MISHTMLWLVWQERNALIFEDNARTLEHLKCLLFRTLFLWARVWGCTNCIAVSDFLVSISFSSWSFCIFFLVQSVHHREHDVQFFLNKSLITYQKKKWHTMLGPLIDDHKTSLPLLIFNDVGLLCSLEKLKESFLLGKYSENTHFKYT